MALTKEQIAVNYPLPVYNYKVDIGDKTIGFSEVSGLDIAHETITYKESSLTGLGPIAMYMPGQGTPANITLKKGFVTGVSVPILFDWLNSIQLNRVEKKDIYVRLCDETGAAVVSWKVINAFPTKLEAPSFTAESNEVAIESMELMADGVSVEEA
ncbi:MAG: phage tail-like protein [Halioglobus sp.]|jgi:phage tail-like protein